VASKPSKFTSIFDAPQDPEPEIVPAPVALSVPQPSSTPTPPAEAPPADLEEGRAQPPRAGRPANGKKSDPNYRQVTAYIRKELYEDVTFALHQDSRGQPKRKEFSELVDELLERWRQERSGLRDDAI
jgi:hypothetical protein